jgi:hypothetical protein
MLGWRMKEEAKLEFTLTVNWRREDGSIATTQLVTLDRGACRSAEDAGLQLADAKPILGRLKEIVVSEQQQRYCEAVRPRGQNRWDRRRPRTFQIPPEPFSISHCQRLPGNWLIGSAMRQKDGILVVTHFPSTQDQEDPIG